MKKILLIAPSQPNINSIPEIRAITEMHRTYVLNGNLTIEEIFQAVRHSEYDIIHIATHTLEDNHFDKFPINSTENLTIDDLVQIGKLSKASLFFFNSCHSARSAYYIIKRISTSSIYTTIEIEDANAWKLPLSFYQVLATAEATAKTVNLKTVFDSIDDESGNYGFVTSADLQVDAIQHLTQTVEQLSHTVSNLEETITNINQTTVSNTNAINTYVKNVNNGMNSRIVIIMFIVATSLMSLNAAASLLGYIK